MNDKRIVSVDLNEPPTIEDLIYTNKNKPKSSIKSTGICFICKKKSKIIDSHTVPRSALEIISDNGIVFNAHFFAASLHNMPDFSTLGQRSKFGIGEAMVFRYLCDSCDKKFAPYESEYAIENWTPDQNQLAQIALKNLLYRKWDWENERSLSIPNFDSKNTTRLKMAVSTASTHRMLLAASDQEMSKLLKHLDRAVAAVNSAESDNPPQYKIVRKYRLPWLAPVSAQGAFLAYRRSSTSSFGLNPLPTNDDPFVHLAILPGFNKSTNIFVFGENSDFSRLESIYTAKNLFTEIDILIDHSDEGFLFSSNMSPDMYGRLPKDTKAFKKSNSLSHGKKGSLEKSKSFESRSSFHILDGPLI